MGDQRAYIERGDTRAPTSRPLGVAESPHLLSSFVKPLSRETDG